MSLLAVFGGLYIGWLGSTLLAVRLLDEGAYLDAGAVRLRGIFGQRRLFRRAAVGANTRLIARVSAPKKPGKAISASVVGGPIFGALVGRSAEH